MKLILLLLLLFPSSSYAATINAATCSIADINTAIASAAHGDVVAVPASPCTWTTPLISTVKNITIQGAGAGATIITIVGVTSPVIDLGTTVSRITGFTFNVTSLGANSTYIIRVRGQGWRVDHNTATNNYTATVPNVTFVYPSGGTGIPHPTGVIDHNTFNNTRVDISGDLRLLASAIWFESSKIGNPDQTGVIYIETNTFNRTNPTHNSVDANYGGRYVFRYNTVNDSAPEVHSSQGNNRAARSWEIYNNTFAASLSPTFLAFIRGGTGVFYNNTATGNYPTTGLSLDNVRSFTSFTFPPGKCDGSSSWDGNTTVGWPCRDQIGRGADASLWNTAPYPAQASEPAYFWNNTLNGNPIVPTVVNCTNVVKTNGSCADIVSGRDYIADGTPKPGYTAYTYPHPLISTWDGTNGGGGGGTLPAPGNVKISKGGGMIWQ